MFPLAPELGPQNPVTRSLLIELALLCGFLFVWGASAAGRKFVEAIYGMVNALVRKASFGVIGAPKIFHQLTQWLTTKLGEWEAGASAHVGQYFHDLGFHVIHLGQALQSQASTGFQVSLRLSAAIDDLLGIDTKTGLFGKKLARLDKSTISALNAQQNRLEGLSNRQTHAAKATAADAQLAQHNVGYTRRQLRALNARWVALAGALYGIHAIPHGDDAGTLAPPVPGVIPRPSAEPIPRAGTHGGVIPRIGARVGRLEKILAGLGVVALVGTALRKMGLGWALCRNWKRVGPTVCGMDANLLEDLLSASLLIVGSISIVQLAEELQGVMDDAVTGFEAFVREL